MIKFFTLKRLLGLFISVLVSSVAMAQPSVCTTPPAGYLKGGSLGTDNDTPCRLQNGFTNNYSNALGSILSNAKLYIDIDSTFNPSTNTSGIPFPANNRIANQAIPDKLAYYALVGEHNGKKYLTCAKVEVLRNDLQPVLTANNCSANNISINVQNDPSNKYNRYTISFGSGIPDEVIDMAGKTLPFTVNKTLSSVPPQISVIAEYKRGNQLLCASLSKNVVVDGVNLPIMARLEGKNEGKEYDISFLSYINNKSYDLEAKIEGTNTWSKITQASNGGVNVNGLSSSNKYCFRLSFQNACGVTAFSKNEICSINLNAQLHSTSSATISWNKPSTPSFTPNSLKFLKSTVGCSTCNNNPPLSSNALLFYKDNFLDCTKEYIYNLSTSIGTGFNFNGMPFSVTIISAPLLVNPKSLASVAKPSQIASVSFDPVDDTKVRVVILEPAASSISSNELYTFYRAVGNSPVFDPLGTSKSNTFDDIAITLGQSEKYCYKYSKKDNCGVTSTLSEPFCTVLLSDKKSGNTAWTPYLIPPTLVTSVSNVEYQLQFLNPVTGVYEPVQGNFITALTQNVQPLLDKATTDEIKFRVFARQNIVSPDFPSGQITPSYSNTIIIPVPPKFFIPTAFTPNGDGNNDVFSVGSKFINDGTIKVYDRWGGTLYEGDINSVWDGSDGKSNSPVPPGNYPFIINATTLSGKPIRQQGAILIMK
jgi:gliding motility-associated-like protein